MEKSDLRFQTEFTLFSLLWGRPWKRERHKWGKEKEWESEERVCWKISLIPKQTPVSHMKVRAAFLSSRTATQVLYCARVWVPLFQPVPMIQLDRKLWNSQPAHSSHSNSLAKHTLSLSLSLTPSLSLSAHRHQLICYTQCPASCTQLPSRRVESREKVLTHMLDLASRGLKYIKRKHLLLTENEVNNSKTGSNKGKKLECCLCQH